MELLLKSLDADTDPHEIRSEIEDAGVYYSFGPGFTQKVLWKVFSEGNLILKETEYMSTVNFAYRMIAFAGIAAIILLMISILSGQGSFSFNSLLGLGNGNDESIVCLLTGIR